MLFKAFQNVIVKIYFTQIYNTTTDTWRRAASFELPAFGSGGASSPCDSLWLFVCFVFGPGGALFHATVFVFSFVFGPGVACFRR